MRLTQNVFFMNRSIIWILKYDLYDLLLCLLHLWLKGAVDTELIHSVLMSLTSQGRLYFCKRISWNRPLLMWLQAFEHKAFILLA